MQGLGYYTANVRTKSCLKEAGIYLGDGFISNYLFASRGGSWYDSGLVKHDRFEKPLAASRKTEKYIMCLLKG